MTNKSKILLGTGTIVGAALVGGIILASITLNQKQTNVNQQTEPSFYLVTNPNNPTAIQGITTRTTKFVSQTSAGKDLIVKMNGLTNAKEYKFLYKLEAETAFMQTNVIANASGETEFKIVNFMFGQQYVYKLMDGETVVEPEYKTIVSLEGPVGVVEATSSEAKISFSNMALYSGIAGQKIQFEYKLKSEKDFRIAIGPFDIPLNETTFEIKISTLQPNRIYEWKLSTGPEKTQIQKGEFQTLQIS